MGSKDQGFFNFNWLKRSKRSQEQPVVTPLSHLQTARRDSQTSEARNTPEDKRTLLDEIERVTRRVIASVAADGGRSIPYDSMTEYPFNNDGISGNIHVQYRPRTRTLWTVTTFVGEIDPHSPNGKYLSTENTQIDFDEQERVSRASRLYDVNSDFPSFNRNGADTIKSALRRAESARKTAVQREQSTQSE